MSECRCKVDEGETVCLESGMQKVPLISSGELGNRIYTSEGVSIMSSARRMVTNLVEVSPYLNCGLIFCGVHTNMMIAFQTVQENWERIFNPGLQYKETSCDNTCSCQMTNNIGEFVVVTMCFDHFNVKFKNMVEGLREKNGFAGKFPIARYKKEWDDLEDDYDYSPQRAVMIERLRLTHWQDVYLANYPKHKTMFSSVFGAMDGHMSEIDSSQEMFMAKLYSGRITFALFERDFRRGVLDWMSFEDQCYTLLKNYAQMLLSGWTLMETAAICPPRGNT